MNLEWIWPKNKFLDRKAEMAELFFDLRDGAINSEKYKNTIHFMNHQIALFKLAQPWFFQKLLQI